MNISTINTLARLVRCQKLLESLKAQSGVDPMAMDSAIASLLGEQEVIIEELRHDLDKQTN